MTKEELRKDYGGIVKQYSKCMGRKFYTDDYVKHLEKQLLIHSVVDSSVTISKQEYDALKRDSENLQKVSFSM